MTNFHGIEIAAEHAVQQRLIDQVEAQTYRLAQAREEILALSQANRLLQRAARLRKRAIIGLLAALTSEILYVVFFNGYHH